MAVGWSKSLTTLVGSSSALWSVSESTEHRKQLFSDTYVVSEGAAETVPLTGLVEIHRVTEATTGVWFGSALTSSEL